MSGLKETISRKFDFLSANGFVVDENSINEELKDFILIFQNDKIRFRFIQDRADFFLDVASAKTPDRWIEFSKIIHWLEKNNYISEKLTISNTLPWIKKNLQQNLVSIEKYFESNF